MKFSRIFFAALVSTATASSWFGKTPYNQWHQTELERWLSDNDIPYPAAADRKELESLVKSNWQSYVVDPIQAAGEKISGHSAEAKEWIFDSWTESELKAFLDYHKIPAPEPRARDKLLAAARQNYDAVAKKIGEHAVYPGNWLWQSWSESDLKQFLDERGVPFPQNTDRDKLVTIVRRHAYLAPQKLSSASASLSSGVSSGVSVASKSAASTKASLSDLLFDTWSESKLKELLDSNGVAVPQGSRKNELVALARKYHANFVDGASSVASSVADSFGAATSKAGNQFAKATDDASLVAEDAFNSLVATWSESRLKAFLDARGVPVPQGSTQDELIKQVRLNKHKAASGWSTWTFDTWTIDNLRSFLEAGGQRVTQNTQASRDELLKQVQDIFASASKHGGSQYASVTSYLASATDASRSDLFDTWSESDLKNYLDSYGIHTKTGSTLDELREEVRKQASYFRFGTLSSTGSIVDQLKANIQWLGSQFQRAVGQFQGTAASGITEASKSLSSASKLASSSVASVKTEL